MKPTLETIIAQLTVEAYANIGKQFAAIADAQDAIQEAIVLAEVLESVNATPQAILHSDCCNAWVLALSSHDELIAALAAARLPIGEDQSDIDSDYACYHVEGFQVPVHVARRTLSELKLAA